MSLFHYRTRPDRRFGFVLIAVFTLGILGGSLATFLNGGVVPATHTATVHLTKTAAPLQDAVVPSFVVPAAAR